MRPLTKNAKTLIISVLFIFSLSVNLHPQDIQCVWTGVEKIVAVGDVHGAYDNFVRILQATGLIDEGLHWIGGKIHLVQTGDIMDRDTDAKKVFDLLMTLEKEAEAGGGKVHFLIGNHEELNITGIALDQPGYVTPEQFASFLPEKFRKKKEDKLRKTIEVQPQGDSNSSSSFPSYLRDFWQGIIKSERGKGEGEARRMYTNTFNDTYGKWIISHNAVIKINNIIFAHGGVSKKYSTRKLNDINRLLRTELEECRLRYKRFLQPKERYQIVYDSKGPLWYREIAQKDEKMFKPELEQILKDLKADHMVIAHTPRAGSPVISEELMSRFEGKIWVIDTGISHFGGLLSALIIENGKFNVWGEAHE